MKVPGRSPRVEGIQNFFFSFCKNFHRSSPHFQAYTWWLDDMYMNIKLPVVINSSPGWTFPRQSFQTERDMAKYASKFITGLLEYKDVLDRRAWPVDRATSREKGQPLCMEQYYRFFTSYRVPGIEKDHLRSTWCDVAPDDQHIIVAKNNQASFIQKSKFLCPYYIKQLL